MYFKGRYGKIKERMEKADPGTAVASAVKSASYFLVPLSIFLLIFWFLMVYAHIRVVSGRFSPYPRWCLVFSMLPGTLLFSLVGLFGNHEIINAFMAGLSAWEISGAFQGI